MQKNRRKKAVIAPSVYPESKYMKAGFKDFNI